MKDPKTGLPWKTSDAVGRFLLETVVKKNVSYTFPQALRDAGYSVRYVHSYASRIWENVGVQDKINGYKAKAAVKAELTVSQVLDDLDFGIKLARERGDLMAIARFSELRGKYLSMYSDGLNLNDTTQQKEINEAELLEAKRMAEIRLKQG